MCTRPLYIKNKGYDPSCPISRRFNVVPCGKCDECITGRCRETQFRCEWEMIDCQNKGGFGAFVTLTYAPKYLPIVTYRDPLSNKVMKLSTWNQHHITNFLKSLRNRGIEFRYLCTAERGHDEEYIYKGRVRRGTKRPHYHFCFFVYNCTESDFYDALVETWTYGRIDDKKICRTQEKAIQYVTKYAFKQQGENLYRFSPSDVLYHNQSVSYSDMLPRTRQSNGIGSFYLEHIMNRPQLVEFLTDGVVRTNTGDCMSVPRYYWKKLTSKLEVCGIAPGRIHREVFKYPNDAVKRHSKRDSHVFQTFGRDLFGNKIITYEIDTNPQVHFKSVPTELGFSVYWSRFEKKINTLYDQYQALSNLDKSNQMLDLNVPFVDQLDKYDKTCFTYFFENLDQFRDILNFSTDILGDLHLSVFDVSQDTFDSLQRRYYILMRANSFYNNYIKCANSYTRKLRFKAEFMRRLQENAELFLPHYI